MLSLGDPTQDILVLSLHQFMPRRAGQRCTLTQSPVHPVQHEAHLDVLYAPFPALTLCC